MNDTHHLQQYLCSYTIGIIRAVVGRWHSEVAFWCRLCAMLTQARLSVPIVIIIELQGWPAWDLIRFSYGRSMPAVIGLSTHLIASLLWQSWAHSRDLFFTRALVRSQDTGDGRATTTPFTWRRVMLCVDERVLRCISTIAWSWVYCLGWGSTDWCASKDDSASGQMW